MADLIEELVDWCRKELDSSEQQIELFGAKGAEAILVLPDGARQDITERVLEHQKELFSRLRLLEAPSRCTVAMATLAF